MMPKLDGMEVMKIVRERSLIPILIMSAKDSDVDKAVGLGLGADDYIAKPFSMVGDKDISLTRINMNEVCRKNILAFYDILTNTGIEVIIDIPEKNIYSLGNEEALDRIINNLISNSIKYGKEGKVLGFSLRADEDYVYIEIWDKGKGIFEIHKDRVFEKGLQRSPF